ncbi:MAG TPA: ABC transporter substrate-binding protein [Nitrospiria bacterium]|nr:ABC transporter substrate-binding protein [Nitrospiria bacterium]
MTRTRFVRVALYLFSSLAALVVTACSSTPPPNTLVVAIESSPITLDPRFATDAYSERITQLLFNSLVRVDAAFQVVPELALSWTQPAPQTYRFVLRRGVKFHDGAELTANDVRYTFASILDPATASPFRSVYGMIDRITVTGPYEIEFHLSAPHAPFLVNLVRGIVPARLASRRDEFARHPVGSGPFRLVRWAPDDRVVLVAFKDYFDGAPSLDGVIVKIIPDETIRLLELQKGTIDLVQNAITPEVLPLLNASGRFRVVVSPGTTYTYLGFNLRDPVLSDVRVRRAIALAIDRPAIIRTLLGGLAEPATGLLPPALWAYETEVTRYDFDPVRARRLLDDAGVVDPDGPGPQPRLRLTFDTSQNDQARRIAEVIQQQLAQIGIDLTIRSHEWGAFYADIKAGRFQLYTLSWVGIVDPDLYFEVFHSSSLPPAGSNRDGYANPAVDRLLERGRRSADTAERRAVYREVQRIVADDLPYVSLWYPTNVVVLSKRVEGFVPSPSGDWTSLARVTLRHP